MGTWHDPNVGRPIAAPLERRAELLGVDLATVRELAAKVEPYARADGTKNWSLMQLERQLRPEAYGRRRSGYLDRRRLPATDASSIRPSVAAPYGAKRYGPSAKLASDPLHAIYAPAALSRPITADELPVRLSVGHRD